MPELDVLRGAAVLMVVLYHGLYWSGAVSSTRLGMFLIKASVVGWLGVNLFFVLSGFLISGILLDSKGHSSYYRRFYQRRVVRILPAYLVTIAVLLLLHFLPSAQHSSRWFFSRTTTLFRWSAVTAPSGRFRWKSILSLLASPCGESEPSCPDPRRGRCLYLRAHPAVVVRLRCYPSWRHARQHVSDSRQPGCGALIAIFARSRFGSIRNGQRLGAE